jgi:hypothetical protein
MVQVREMDGCEGGNLIGGWEARHIRAESPSVANDTKTLHACAITSCPHVKNTFKSYLHYVVQTTTVMPRTKMRDCIGIAHQEIDESTPSHIHALSRSQLISLPQTLLDHVCHGP